MYGADVDQDHQLPDGGAVDLRRCNRQGIGDDPAAGGRQKGTRTGEQTCIAEDSVERAAAQAIPVRSLQSEFTPEGLDFIGITDYNLGELLRMNVATESNIAKLSEIGNAMGELVKPEHLG